MATPSDAAKRRHKRDKGVIEHLVEKVFDTAATIGLKPTKYNAKTDTGLSVEKQIRKEWNPRKGGLPILSKHTV